MKRRLLGQLFLVLTLLVSHAGFASGYPQKGGSGPLNNLNPNSCTKTSECFVFNYKGYSINAGKVTLTFSIKNNCPHDLSYAAFEIPSGSTATATGMSKFKYKTTITNKPFRSIKFEGLNIAGYKNGAEDEFKYTLSEANFKKLTTIRVQAKAGTKVGRVTFVKNCSDAPLCINNSVTPTNIIYTVDGVTSSNLQNVAKPGKNVKVCFTVPKTNAFNTYSLVSYTAPTATFDRTTAELQDVFDRQTINVGPDGGSVCLEVKVPDCYFQIDFVKGCVIEKLGPANSDNFYIDQARLIDAATGGTAPCTPLCIVSSVSLTNITYNQPPNETPLSPSRNSAGNYRFDKLVQGKPINVCFTVPASSGISTYSLVSYTAPYPYFDRNSVNLQKVFDYKTINVGPKGGSFCLQINLPNCNYQVDLVKGCVIENLTPENLYSITNRLIAFRNGGTIDCVPVIPPVEPEPEIKGDEGCTPGYWKQQQHFGNWPSPLIPTGTTATKFFDIFTVCEMDGTDCSYQGLNSNLTLLEALGLNGGGFNALARHAAAAYLNAKSKSVKYSFTSMEIKGWVITAFKTGNAEATKNKLEKANEQNCPLGRSELTNAITAKVPELALSQSVTPLSAYPNPFNNRAVVQFALKNTEEFSVSLYNINGKQVRVLKTGAANAGELVQLNIDGIGLSEGLYLVRLVTKTETQTVKLLLKK